MMTELEAMQLLCELSRMDDVQLGRFREGFGSLYADALEHGEELAASSEVLRAAVQARTWDNERELETDTC